MAAQQPVAQQQTQMQWQQNLQRQMQQPMVGQQQMPGVMAQQPMPQVDMSNLQNQMKTS